VKLALKSPSLVREHFSLKQQSPFSITAECTLPPLCSVLVSHSTNSLATLSNGNNSLVLMLSGIVNGYQLLCDAHTVQE